VATVKVLTADAMVVMEIGPVGGEVDGFFAPCGGGPVSLECRAR
jgi:hypothetical protein